MSPTHAEQARTILAANTEGTLATVDIDGRPVVSPVPMVADGAGVPVIVVSNLSTHSSRGRRDTRAGMDIGGRLLMQGDLRPVPGIQQIELTDAICLARPELRTAIESLDWSWLRLEPTRVRLTDGNCDERWLRPADVAGAEPDPLILLGEDFIEVRKKLADQLLLIAKTLGGRWLATSAEVAAVDRYGLVLDVAEPAGLRPSRVPFPDRLDHAEDVHAALGGLVLAARAAARRDDVPDNPTAWPDKPATVTSRPVIVSDPLDAESEAPASPTPPTTPTATASETETKTIVSEAAVSDSALSEAAVSETVVSETAAPFQAATIAESPDACDAVPASAGSAMIDGLRQAAAQTRLQGPTPDAESILFTEAELYQSDGIRPWRDGDELAPVVPEDAASFDEPSETSADTDENLARS